MFTVYHFIWLFICATFIITGLFLLKKNKVSLEKAFTFACIGCVCSELLKVFGTIKMVPLADGSGFTPYIEMANLPLHLCSYQIILIFLVRFMKNQNFKQLILSFMYPTCTAGAIMALLLPSLFSEDVMPHQAFIKPHAYEYFLYHAMLIILGIYIYISGEAKIKPKNYFSTVLILIICAFFSLYLNSIFATPVYESGELVSIQHMPNFFFTFLTPIDIPLLKISHWYIYLSIIIALGLLIVALFYLPVFIGYKDKQKAENEKEEVAVKN